MHSSTVSVTFGIFVQRKSTLILFDSSESFSTKDQVPFSQSSGQVLVQLIDSMDPFSFVGAI